jgi:hypothetical protein
VRSRLGKTESDGPAIMVGPSLRCAVHFRPGFHHDRGLPTRRQQLALCNLAELRPTLQSPAVSGRLRSALHETVVSAVLTQSKRLAEGVGFEPTNGFHRWRFSRPLPSTARPPFRIPTIVRHLARYSLEPMRIIPALSRGFPADRPPRGSSCRHVPRNPREAMPERPRDVPRRVR